MLLSFKMGATGSHHFASGGGAEEDKATARESGMKVRLSVWCGNQFYAGYTDARQTVVQGFSPGAFRPKSLRPADCVGLRRRTRYSMELRRQRAVVSPSDRVETWTGTKGPRVTAVFRDP